MSSRRSESRGADMTFDQIWNENKHYSSMGAVTSAESCAKKGDGPEALEYLSKAGKWALGIAEQIGVPMAAEVLKVAVSGYLGIPKV